MGEGFNEFLMGMAKKLVPTEVPVGDTIGKKEVGGNFVFLLTPRV